MLQHCSPRPHLQRHDLLVTFVEPCCEGDHDVTLLEQQRLVPVHLRQVLLHSRALRLQLLQPRLVLACVEQGLGA